MKQHPLPLLLLSVLIISSFRLPEEKAYDFHKKYKTEQLRDDLLQVKAILQSTHPRLYEYTPKAAFDSLFDSLYKAIDHEMTEREFQYFLSPVIAKTHCSHTKLLPSKDLSERINEYLKVPRFRLYFDGNRAFLRSILPGNHGIEQGAEILSVNGIKTGQIIRNFTDRIHNEGRNSTFIYNRLNTAAGLFPGICDYPVIGKYTLSYINPRSKDIQQITLAAVSQEEYAKLSPPAPNYSYRLIDSLNTAIITIRSFKFRIDSSYQHFVEHAFTEIREKKISSLIIDVRGNIGGLPEPAAEILRNISDKEFSYYTKKVAWEFNNTISPAKDHFSGKVYFLIDGGCRSTTGHFLSLAKFHQLGAMIGEEACASFSCNSNGRPHTLSHSALILECPYTTFDVMVQGQERGNGIMPDIYMKASADDVVSGKDRVLLYALDLIGKR